MPELLRFDPELIAPLQERLNSHPVYALRDLPDLRRFMEHHIYSVWDFMSLIKYLQAHIAPVRYPWGPVGDPAVRRFINELVLEEESDTFPGPDGDDLYMSHFELYCGAMTELGANPEGAKRFVEVAHQRGIDAALAAGIAPAPAAGFVRSTFDFIATDKPHVVAAALAVGREHVIPGMFRSFLREMDIGPDEAPQFHFYLNRHIHLDEDFHGPLSLRMLDLLCAGDPVKLDEAHEAARASIEARIRFWDGVHAGMAEAA